MKPSPDDYLTLAAAIDPATRTRETLHAALAIVARWLGGLDEESAREAINARPCPYDVAYAVLGLTPAGVAGADGTEETARAIFAVQLELSRLGVVSRATPDGDLEHAIMSLTAPDCPDYPPAA